MRLIGPLRRPLWLVAAVGEGVLEVALGMVREVRSALEEVTVSEPEAGLFDRTRTSGTAGGRPAPARRPAPPRPPVPEELKTLDDEPVLVAEFGEQGAREDAGAQVSVEPPWEGYDRMNVPEVKDRLATADSEVLAAVVLYEGSPSGAVRSPRRPSAASRS